MQEYILVLFIIEPPGKAAKHGMRLLLPNARMGSRSPKHGRRPRPHFGTFFRGAASPTSGAEACSRVGVRPQRGARGRFRLARSWPAARVTPHDCPSHRTMRAAGVRAVAQDPRKCAAYSLGRLLVASGILNSTPLSPICL